jgi:hypothetical protein
MGVHQVNDNSEAKGVSLIDQVLEVIRRSGPRRDTEKASDMIPKTSIVGMLLNGHELDNIISTILNPL